jgi:hypothetical protein
MKRAERRLQDTQWCCKSCADLTRKAAELYVPEFIEALLLHEKVPET